MGELDECVRGGRLQMDLSALLRIQRKIREISILLVLVLQRCVLIFAPLREQSGVKICLGPVRKLVAVLSATRAPVWTCLCIILAT